MAPKFCKVCCDAGKTKEEYTNHFVRASREPGAPVVCPTLLALNCNYCHKNGHTPKYCPALKKAKMGDSRGERIPRKKAVLMMTKDHTPTPKKTVVSANPFDVLMNDKMGTTAWKRTPQKKVSSTPQGAWAKPLTTKTAAAVKPISPPELSLTDGYKAQCETLEKELASVRAQLEEAKKQQAIKENKEMETKAMEINLDMAWGDMLCVEELM